MAKLKDYYHVLGLKPRAHVRLIEKTYWEQAHQLQKQPTKRAARRLAVINEAYEVLGTPHRRLAYDREYLEQLTKDEDSRKRGFWRAFGGLVARPFRLD